MRLPKDYTKCQVNVPLKHPDEADVSNNTPHIQKFERKTGSLKAQEALEQSTKIFGPFRQTPRTEKTSFIKSQEKSFLRTTKERDK